MDAPRLATALTLLLAAGCHRPAPKRLPQAVVVAPVERAVADVGLRYAAHVEPASQVDVAFKVGGYVERIATAPDPKGKPRVLQEGDEVTRGEELVALRRTDFDQQLAAARAARAQAEAQIAQVRLDLARSESLRASDSIPQAQLDADRSRLASATASLAGAAARVDEATLALSDSTLRAPLAATVVRRNVEVGALAAPGVVTFTLADLATVKVVFAVPDTGLASVKLGAPQTVTSEAFPGQVFRGTITRISPAADPRSHVFETEVAIPNPDRRLKPGMVAALALGAEPAAPAPAATPRSFVPLSAIVRGPAGGFAVYVVTDEAGGAVAHARPVELGEYLGRVVAVERGLAAGDRVVTQGAGLLSDGETVEVVP